MDRMTIKHPVERVTARHRAECQRCHAIIPQGSDFWMVTLSLTGGRMRIVRCLGCGRGSYYRGAHLYDTFDLRNQDARIAAHGTGHANSRNEADAIAEMFSEVPWKRKAAPKGLKLPNDELSDYSTMDDD